MEYKVAAIQMDIKHAKKEENIDKAIKLLDEAASKDAKAVCFPEYFLTGCPQQGQTMEEIKALAETIPGPTILKFAEKAKKYGLFIVAGSIIELKNNQLFNTSVLISPEGKIIGKFKRRTRRMPQLNMNPGVGYSQEQTNIRSLILK